MFVFEFQEYGFCSVELSDLIVQGPSSIKSPIEDDVTGPKRGAQTVPNQTSQMSLYLRWST